MKKVMPFVQLIKESYAQNGVQALDLTSDFDASAVIRENLDYLRTTLEVIISFLNENRVLKFYLCDLAAGSRHSSVGGRK